MRQAPRESEPKARTRSPKTDEDLVSIAETCRCGSVFGARAKDQRTLGLVRTAHADWKREHARHASETQGSVSASTDLLGSMIEDLRKDVKMEVMRDTQLLVNGLIETAISQHQVAFYHNPSGIKAGGSNPEFGGWKNNPDASGVHAGHQHMARDGKGFPGNYGAMRFDDWASQQWRPELPDSEREAKKPGKPPHVQLAEAKRRKRTE